MINAYNLESIYSNQKSFYGKARVIEMENGYKILTSYNTIVSEIDENNNIVFVNYHSQTTAKHINEFLMQNGHNKMTKKEIENF
ncbi:Hypothetical protein, partial [Staphylococcus phage Stab23]